METINWIPNNGTRPKENGLVHLEVEHNGETIIKYNQNALDWDWALWESTKITKWTTAEIN